mmetsp:Transcript_29798/g.59022  ORF Transcript_29798/g.59022 Transcript_29798/m.59022 type:complete len:81 (+) Transcript_29798:898-1140(+)
MIDDLCLLHGDGEKENVLEPVDFAVLYQAAEFSYGHPDVFVAVATASASSATAISTTTATTTTTTAETSTSSFVRHFDRF